MSGIRTLVVVLLVGAGAVPCTLASAFPGNSRWPAGSTINVFVQNIDPAGANSRQRLFADGLERWAPEFDRGYTIHVNLGDPPDPPPANLVRFTWADPGTRLNGLELGALGAISTSSWRRNAQTGDRDIFAGQGIISNRWTTGTPPERETLRNLAMHEMTHILGLADDANGRVTNTNVQVGGVMTFNDRDRQEIASLYGRRPQPPDLSNVPRGYLERTNAGTGRYDYRATFEGDSSEIIDVITFDIDPSLVTNVVAPAGWLYMDPAEVALYGPAYSFFSDYMEDGTNVPAPWEHLDYLTFRSSAPLYDLSTSNPVLDFSLFTVNDLLGSISAHAGGSAQWLPGPVPEPGTLALLALSVLTIPRRR